MSNEKFYPSELIPAEITINYDGGVSLVDRLGKSVPSGDYTTEEFNETDRLDKNVSKTFITLRSKVGSEWFSVPKSDLLDFLEKKLS